MERAGKGSKGRGEEAGKGREGREGEEQSQFIPISRHRCAQSSRAWFG